MSRRVLAAFFVFMKMKKKQLLEGILLAAVLAFSISQIYMLHYSYTGRLMVFRENMQPVYRPTNVENAYYPYPLHGDEWIHIAQALYMLESGTPGFADPYSPELPFHMDMEWGYHLMLASLFLMGADPMLSSQYIPAVFFAMNSILLYLFVRRFTGSSHAGLLSLLFFLAIPSNVYITGNWFATPLTFSVFLVFGFLILIDEFAQKRERRYLLYSSAAYAATALVYPPAAALSALLLAVYAAARLKLHKNSLFRDNRLQFTLIFLSLSVIAVTLFSEQIIFSTSWTPKNVYSPYLPLLYGVPPFAAAAVGGIVALRKRLNPVLIFWPLILLASTMSYIVTGYGIIFPFVRGVYYLLLGLVPLASLGLLHVISLVRGLLGQKLNIRNAYVVALFSVIIVLANFYLVFDSVRMSYETDSVLYNMHALDSTYIIYHLVEEPQYEAIKFIREKYGKGNVVMTDDFTAIAVYPISMNHVVAMQSGNLGHGKEETVWEFFGSGCQKKMEMAGSLGFGIVLSKERISCDFLKEVYADDEGAYVYEVTA